MATDRYASNPAVDRQRPARAALRVGVFGGTFNPIHLGHLRSAEEVAEAHALDRVLFVPSATPPHKRTVGLASAADRLAMVRLALTGNPRFRVSSIEIDRGGRSFSVDTLRALRTRMPTARFTFIVGDDAFREIASWKEYTAFFGLCDVVVTSRPPGPSLALATAVPVAVREEFCYRRDRRFLEHSTGHRIAFQQLTNLDISSTVVRQLLRHGRSVRYLIPTPVERYIRHHGLYAGPAGLA